MTFLVWCAQSVCSLWGKGWMQWRGMYCDGEFGRGIWEMGIWKLGVTVLLLYMKVRDLR